MKTRNILFVLASLMFAGCDVEQAVIEYSPNKTEAATVVDLVYMPKNHGSGVSPTLHMGDDGGLHLGVAVSDIDIPEKFAVVFECQHGKFVIDNDQAQASELYQRLHRDQKVIITYQEVYETTKKGDTVVTPRRLVKFHFIDAQPVPVEPEKR